MSILLLSALAMGQERPITGSSCEPLAYSDYLVVLNDRVLGAGDAYAESIDDGYDVAESRRKALVAVVTNTRAQVTSLGDCQGDTNLRDSLVRLIDFWDDMARNGLVTITGYLRDGQISADESESAARILGELGTSGTRTENDVIEEQRKFAARFGFTVAGSEPIASEPEPAYVEPPAEPTYEPEYEPPVKHRVSHDPSIFIRLHGALGLDYLFESGRRRDAYVLGADVNAGRGFRLGGVYKHDLLGELELERVQLLMRYGISPDRNGKVVNFGVGVFVNPGVALVPDSDLEFGLEIGGELVLNANIHERFSLGLFYRIDYGLWFPDGGVARESLGTWEVEPGLSMTVGI